MFIIINKMYLIKCKVIDNSIFKEHLDLLKKDINYKSKIIVLFEYRVSLIILEIRISG